MTTIEEKAREIVIKMQFQKQPLMFEQAKQCALIAVDEILLHEKNSHSVLDKATEYWQEVRNEIEKL
jgi:hypothetical protein